MISHLESDIFDLFKFGEKDIEVRINDEKRRKLFVGSKLLFLKRPEEKEKLETTVKKLEYYNNFDELVQNYPIERMFYSDYTKKQYLEELNKFYTEEEQNKYGVVAIIVAKKDN